METNPVLTHFVCVLHPDPSSYFSFFHVFLTYFVHVHVSFFTFSYFSQISLCLQADVPSNEIPTHRSRPQGESKHRLWHLLTSCCGPSFLPCFYLQDMFFIPFFNCRPSTFSYSTLLPMTTIATSSTTGISHLQGVPEKVYNRFLRTILGCQNFGPLRAI